MPEFTPKKMTKDHRRPVKLLTEMRERIASLSPVHEGPDGPLSQLASDLIRLCSRLEDRLDWGGDAPLLVAVLGATGTGKSKIFNSLLGSFVSPSGFKRPTTMAPVLYSPASSLPGLSRPVFFSGYQKRNAEDGRVRFSPEAEKELIVIGSKGPRWGNLVLVDTPDFDSVLETNRQAASDVFDRADAVVFVTDAVKYADQASWDYLERIKGRDKTAVLVVNRVKNLLSLDDFSSRLAREGVRRPVLSLMDQPGLADVDLFSTKLEAIQTLYEQLDAWSGDERLSLLGREAGRDWEELKEGVEQRFLPQLDQAAEVFSSLKTSLKKSAERAQEHLADRLAVAISGELKNSLIAGIQEMFLKWDLMRYPRRILSLPFTFLKDKVLVPLGVMSESGNAGSHLDQEINRLFEANGEALAAAVYEYNQLAAELFVASEASRGLTRRPGFSDIAMSNEKVKEGYAEVRAGLEKWVGEQARELVQGLNLGERMTFYLAQVVSLGLFISIQVHTGGGFSFFDGLIDTALAPVLSKITGHALSRDKVKAFETQASEIHLKGCRQLIAKQATLYESFISEAEQGLSGVDSLRRIFHELADIMEASA